VSDPFPHKLPIDRVRDGERLDLRADEAERAAIADRLELAGLERLEAHAVLTRDGPTVNAEGRVRAVLRQSCVATGEPVPANVDEPFRLAFMPEPRFEGGEQEIELGAEECDVVFHDGATIDLGAAVIDTLALALDPYPRSAGADAALKEAGVLSEEQAGPFAILAQLKKQSP